MKQPYEDNIVRFRASVNIDMSMKSAKGVGGSDNHAVQTADIGCGSLAVY